DVRTEDDLIRSRFPAVLGALLMIVAGYPTHKLERPVRNTQADPVAGRELCSLPAGTEREGRRMRLLQRARPYRHRAIAEMAPLPTEGMRLGPSLQDQLHALISSLPRLPGIEVIGQCLVRGPAQQPDHQTPVRHGIEHRQFLRKTHWVAMRNDWAEQGDFDLMNARRDIGGGNCRRRG